MDEGKHYPFDVTSAVKELDLSHSGDIQKYQLMADFVDLKAGESIGVTKAMQGQVQERSCSQCSTIYCTRYYYIAEIL